MYRNAISFYKTSRPGLILVLLFSFTFFYGFLKAGAPDTFYDKVQGRIDTATFDIAYYQNHHKLTLRLNPSGISLNQNYPTWWYAPRPRAAELKAGTPVSLFADKLTFYGIETEHRTIQPAWFDILHDYFNATFPVFLILSSLLLIIIYHYAEVVRNPYLCMPYVLGILILCFFWGSVNLIIFMLVSGFLVRYIIRKKNSQSTPITNDYNNVNDQNPTINVSDTTSGDLKNTNTTPIAE